MNSLDKSSALLTNILLKRSVEILIERFSSLSYFISDSTKASPALPSNTKIFVNDRLSLDSYTDLTKVTSDIDNLALEGNSIKNSEIYDYGSVSKNLDSENVRRNFAFRKSEIENSNCPNFEYVTNRTSEMENVDYEMNRRDLFHNLDLNKVNRIKGDEFFSRISSTDLIEENECDIIMPRYSDEYQPGACDLERKVSVDLSNSGTFEEVFRLQPFDNYSMGYNQSANSNYINRSASQRGVKKNVQLPQWNYNIVNMNPNAEIGRSISVDEKSVHTNQNYNYTMNNARPQSSMIYQTQNRYSNRLNQPVHNPNMLCQNQSYHHQCQHVPAEIYHPDVVNYDCSYSPRMHPHYINSGHHTHAHNNYSHYRHSVRPYQAIHPI